MASVKLPDVLDGLHPRYEENCGATQPLVVAMLNTARPLLTGMRIAAAGVPEQRNWSPTRYCVMYVQERLAGSIRTQAGFRTGPQGKWKGRRHGRRQDRHWARAWSPEQISNRLPLDFPEDPAMRISPEAIYQALYIQGRGALSRDLYMCLRTGRPLRVPRKRAGSRGRGFVNAEVMIGRRPEEVNDRKIPGHWEGDLILGLGSSAIGTVVERSTNCYTCHE